ncbi:peptide chain release factor 2 [Dialister micraerophilus UPII 345-E]|uniref:Peptide chain release factor 2 n=1 Tax=Dialister micraerophilus UPII 345-E TaxID=910314 RepID=E4L8R0_9FIRM|nr:peptide chain release factor 2 [Dialister micraerophilus UPII 345-E]
MPRLKETIRSYDIQMSDPSFWDDSEKARAISQKATQAKDAYETYTKLFERAESLQELLDMAIEEDDQGMEGDLKQEIEELSAILNKKEIELLLNEEYDTNNAIITFHAGAGGTEAQDWTEMLIRMYIKWAESEGYGIEELNMLPGDEAGIKSAEYIIKGEFAYGLLKSEKGVHRLVRISPFDAAKRRHTSFSAVDVMPEISDDIEVDLNMNDVRVDYYRASGAGGQHVNKTSSAVRMTHLPTGIVAACQNERSQTQNKEQCLRILRAKLFELEMKKHEQLKKNIQGEQQAIEWGSQIRSYVFQPYTLVKDNRTGVETGNVQAVMDGDLNPFIEGFLKSKINK